MHYRADVFQLQRFDNGTRLLTAPQADAQSTCVMVMYAVGSRSDGDVGASHVPSSADGHFEIAATPVPGGVQKSGQLLQHVLRFVEVDMACDDEFFH